MIMEYQKPINFLCDTTNNLSKIRTRNCVEINEDSRRTLNLNINLTLHLKFQ